MRAWITGLQRCAVLSLFLLLSACNFLQGLKSLFGASDTSSSPSTNDDNAHGSRGSERADSSVANGKNLFQVENGGENSRIVRVKLPADRCKAGTITFGLMDGKTVTCSVLGRGVTRWNWQTPPARHNLECMGGTVRTVASDWQKGDGCYFLKDNKRCGATPTGTYALLGLGGTKSTWGGLQSVIMRPRFPTSRKSLLTHSDNRFGKASNLEAPTHSSAGCLKLEPQCQKLFAEFNRRNRGLTMVVE